MALIFIIDSCYCREKLIHCLSFTLKRNFKLSVVRNLSIFYFMNLWYAQQMEGVIYFPSFQLVCRILFNKLLDFPVLFRKKNSLLKAFGSMFLNLSFSYTFLAPPLDFPALGLYSQFCGISFFYLIALGPANGGSSISTSWSS